MTELRDARELAERICGCVYHDPIEAITAIIEADRAVVREQTTAAIVAWLRGQADWYDNADDGWSHYDSKAQALRDEADAIERGEHRQAQETTDEQ